MPPVLTLEVVAILTLVVVDRTAELTTRAVDLEAEDEEDDGVDSTMLLCQMFDEMVSVLVLTTLLFILGMINSTSLSGSLIKAWIISKARLVASAGPL